MEPGSSIPELGVKSPLGYVRLQVVGGIYDETNPTMIRLDFG
jgi:hypothetical protein